MPTYEYECKSCGHRFEEFQQMSDPAVLKCPSCGRKARRCLSAPAGILKAGPSEASAAPCGRGLCRGKDSPCLARGED